MSFRPGFRVWLLVMLNFSIGGVLQLLSGADSMAWLAAGPDDGYPASTGRMAAAVYSLVAFAIPAIVYANVFPYERFRWFRLDRKVKWSQYLLAAVIMISCVFAIDLIYQWSRQMITSPELQELDKVSESYTKWLLHMPGTGDLMICLFANAFVPALAEELFFRGSLQQVVTEWTGKRHAAIWITAAIFSFIHFDMSGFAARLLLGAVLGYMFYWTGSLQISLLGHFAFNGFSIVSEYITQHYPYSGWATMSVSVLMGAVSAFVCGALLFLLYRISVSRR